MSIEMGRRRFAVAGLACAAAAAAAAALSGPALASPFLAASSSKETLPWPSLLGAWRLDNRNFAGLWSPDFGARGIELAFRGHDVVQDPLNPDQALVFARRPGRQIVRIDMATGVVVAEQSTQTHRNLNGHGVFSPDGRSLYTSENDQRSGRGVISVRHAGSLVQYAEFPSQGVGPHSLLVEETNGSLLVANGGVTAIPKTWIGPLDSTDRPPHTMDPSLVRLDARTGRLLGQWRLGDSSLSIRHLARSQPDGVVGVALQAAHSRDEDRSLAPVLALFDGRNEFSVIETSPEQGLEGYGGDIACAGEGSDTLFAVGCSHSDQVAFWNTGGRWCGASALRSACAVAAHGPQVVAVTDQGDGVLITPASDRLARADQRTMALLWENHVAVLPAGSRPSSIKTHPVITP